MRTGLLALFHSKAVRCIALTLFLCATATNTLAGINASDALGHCETADLTHQSSQSDADETPSTDVAPSCCHATMCSTCSATFVASGQLFFRPLRNSVQLSFSDDVLRSLDGSPPYRPPR